MVNNCPMETSTYMMIRLIMASVSFHPVLDFQRPYAMMPVRMISARRILENWSQSFFINVTSFQLTYVMRYGRMTYRSAVPKRQITGHH
jgi:hypothetical protein